MKFKVKVEVAVNAPGTGIQKEDMTSLVLQAIEDTLEQSLNETLMDIVAGETEKEEWEDAFETTVESVET